MTGFMFTEEHKKEMKLSRDNTVIIDGFVFSENSESRYSICQPYMIMHKIPGARMGGFINFSKRSVEDHVQFINDHCVERLRICAENIDFIGQCKCLKKITVQPAEGFEETFDYTPLYDLPE